MLASVSSDSSSPTSPDNVIGGATNYYTPEYHYRKTSKSDQRNAQSVKTVPPKDTEPSNHYKPDKKTKEKDIKFYHKLLSSTGLDRLSKSASATGVPKTPVYKEKFKHGQDNLSSAVSVSDRLRLNSTFSAFPATKINKNKTIE